MAWLELPHQYQKGQGCRSRSRSSSASTTASGERLTVEDGASSVGSVSSQPVPLHDFFNFKDVQRWEKGRFRMEWMLRESSRTKSSVDHMYDATSSIHVAVKRIPNDWITECHEHFKKKHGRQSHQPWVDLGCTAFLTSVGYPYVCSLLGVYRDSEATHIVTDLANEGDLLDFSSSCKVEPGPARESLMRPIAKQIMSAVQHLHDLSIVHRDISLESFVVSRRAGDGAKQVQLISFGRSSCGRYIRGGAARPSYEAPETHSGEVYDGFLSDAFSVGVALFGMLTQECPWMSTQQGRCKAFDFFQQKGFRAFAARRKCFKQGLTIADCMTEPLGQMLEGLLSTNPEERLTLGEAARFEGVDRKSVWDEPWVHGLP